MGILKRLSQVKKINSSEKTDNEKSFEKEKITYHQDGYESSKLCQGFPQNLKTSLEAIYHSFENKCKREEEEQQKLKAPYTTELKGKQTALLLKEDSIHTLNDSIEKCNEEIRNLKQEKIDVKRRPNEFGLDVNSKSSVKFWIGLLFLIPLSLYIFIFYISTSYSGFFRDFDPSVDIFGGMFYPRALTQAWEDGILEFGFIIFIPFVFFGLGYLIHMFQESKDRYRMFKIVMLFVVTFLFDAILAYLIDEKIYNLNKTFEDPQFSIAYALTDPSFWVIIFAGFVSYVIWGLVFDMIMKEHAESDKIQRYIDGIQNEINNSRHELSNLNEQLEDTQRIINEIKTRITELQNIIDGFILPAHSYKALSSEYLQGWQEYISGELAMSSDHTQTRLNECRSIYDDHLRNLDLHNDSYQNKVYSRTL